MSDNFNTPKPEDSNNPYAPKPEGYPEFNASGSTNDTSSSSSNSYSQPYSSYPGSGNYPAASGGYGQNYPQQPMTPRPNNNLVWAILTTLFCFLPLGVVGIVYASQVDSKWAAGDYAGAQEAADKAKKWSMWSAIAFGIIVVLYIAFWLIVIVAAGSGASSYEYSNVNV